MNVFSLEQDALYSNLEKLFTFVEQALGGLSVPESQRGKLMMALDEALTNVVLYAYPKERPGTVNIRIRRDDNTVTAEIVDHGKPFDPTAHPEPDISLPIDKRPIGGLGIHMIRNLVTSLQYRREADANHLILTTSLEATK